MAVDPPSGTDVLTLEDTNGNAFDSRGQVEFDSIPANRSSITIDSIEYQFQNFGTLTASTGTTLTFNDGTGPSGGDEILASSTSAFAALAVGDRITIAGTTGTNADGTFTCQLRSENGAVSDATPMNAAGTGGTGGDLVYSYGSPSPPPYAPHATSCEPFELLPNTLPAAGWNAASGSRSASCR